MLICFVCFNFSLRYWYVYVRVINACVYLYINGICFHHVWDLPCTVHVVLTCCITFRTNMSTAWTGTWFHAAYSVVFCPFFGTMIIQDNNTSSQCGYFLNLIEIAPLPLRFFWWRWTGEPWSTSTDAVPEHGHTFGQAACWSIWPYPGENWHQFAWAGLPGIEPRCSSLTY